MKANVSKNCCVLLAVLLCIAIAPAALAKSYRQGDTGDEVAMIQQALEDIELYYADITGHYGKRTEAAVLKFQKKYDLDQTGIADDQTRKKLYLVADVGVQIPLEEEKSGGYTVMRQGDQGSAVRRLQEHLTELDYYTGSVTGSYGRLTKEAVRLFQRDNGLSSDGVAGPRTLKKIEKELGLAQDGGENLDEAAQREETGGETETKKPKIDLDDVQKLNTEWTLRYSSRSGYVRRLQQALLALGYFDDEVDGHFGSRTEEAVRAYQLARGLTVDGVAGRATLRSINEDVENGVTAGEAGGND